MHLLELCHDIALLSLPCDCRDMKQLCCDKSSMPSVSMFEWSVVTQGLLSRHKFSNSVLAFIATNFLLFASFCSLFCHNNQFICHDIAASFFF